MLLNKDGYTPLASIADMEGFLGDHPAMPLLLAAGADIEIKNKVRRYHRIDCYGDAIY